METYFPLICLVLFHITLLLGHIINRSGSLDVFIILSNSCNWYKKPRCTFLLQGSNVHCPLVLLPISKGLVISKVTWNIQWEMAIILVLTMVVLIILGLGYLWCAWRPSLGWCLLHCTGMPVRLCPTQLLFLHGQVSWLLTCWQPVTIWCLQLG